MRDKATGKDEYTFKPQSVLLTYDVADKLSETTTANGRGVVAVSFEDHQDIGGGRYTVYLKVERVSAPPVEEPPGDTTAPVTTITSGPPAVVASASARFGFSSSEPNSTFECTLDGAAFSSCSSPKAFTGLSDGQHTFRARAKDAAGNIDPITASRIWKVDTTKPRVAGVTPTDGATGVSLAANVSATFSEAMKAGTIGAQTFKLRKQGATTSVPAAVSYDAQRRRATLNPNANLQAGATYIVTVSTGARDAAGNALDQDPSTASEQVKVWKFTTRQNVATNNLAAMFLDGNLGTTKLVFLGITGVLVLGALAFGVLRWRRARGGAG
jgi:hypothetical protein